MIKLAATATSKTIMEPMLPLINVVFLLLIFFMVSGNIAAPINQIKLIEQTSKDQLPPQYRQQSHWLRVDQFGEISRDGLALDLNDRAITFDHTNTVTLIADGRLSTSKLKVISEQLASHHIQRIVLVTQLAHKSNIE